MIAEDQRGEPENIRVVALPAVRGHARFDTRLSEKRHAVPVLFDWNLGQEKSFPIAVLHEQAVPAYIDLLNIEHARQRR